MIEIDGSFGSGGGQILRTASALSVITKKPCHIFNIRAKRPKSGLMPQHLLGLKALAQLCNGRLEGDELGSKEIKFYPGTIYRDSISINIPTAGSITLSLQSLLPVALFSSAPIKIIFKGGGTDVPFSPTMDYFCFVFLRILEKMGVKVEVNILKRGYYPEGGGEVEVKIYPSKLKPLNLIERGEFKKISIFSVASEFLKSKKIAQRQARVAEEIFKKLKLPIETKIEYPKTDCPGSSICILSEYSETILGADNLGKLGKSSEIVGRECALELLKEERSGSCADRFLTDQILVYMALSKKESQVKIGELTPHAKTNIWVIHQFLPGEFKMKNNLIKWIPSE